MIGCLWLTTSYLQDNPDHFLPWDAPDLAVDEEWRLRTLQTFPFLVYDWNIRILLSLKM